MKPLKSGRAKTYSRPLASKSGGAFASLPYRLFHPCTQKKRFKSNQKIAFHHVTYFVYKKLLSRPHQLVCLPKFMPSCSILTSAVFQASKHSSDSLLRRAVSTWPPILKYFEWRRRWQDGVVVYKCCLHFTSVRKYYEWIGLSKWVFKNLKYRLKN